MVEPPRFTKAYYNADYYINAENNGAITITSDAITIDYDNYELVTLKLEGGMYNVFSREAIYDVYSDYCFI